MLAYMFPGQGSQFKSMGEFLFNLFPTETRVASSILGYSIEDLCLHDTQNKLNQTEYTQPAIFIVSCLSYLKRLQDTRSIPNYVCGHSLGEYAALFAAGVLTLKQVFR